MENAANHIIAALAGIIREPVTLAPDADVLVAMCAVDIYGHNDWGIGFANQIGRELGEKLYSEDSQEKYAIPPGPLKPLDYLRMLELTLDETLDGYTGMDPVFRWMKQQMLSTTPNLIQGYVHGFIGEQALRAQEYLDAIARAKAPPHTLHNKQATHFEFDARVTHQGHIALRLERLKQLAGCNAQSPLTPETLKLASTAFITTGMDAASFGGEFRGTLRHALENIDKQSYERFHRDFVHTRHPEFSGNLQSALSTLLETFGMIMHHNNSPLEARQEFLQELAGDVIQLLNANHAYQQQNFSTELDVNDVTHTVRSVFERHFPGMWLEIETPALHDGYYGKPCKPHPDSTMAQILDMLPKPPKDDTPGEGRARR